MAVDPDLCQQLPGGVGICVEIGQPQAVLRSVICNQCLADDPIAVVDAMMEGRPGLTEDENVGISWSMCIYGDDPMLT
jgi:hypothetical protein